MHLLPGLTTTQRDRIPAFLDSMRRLGVEQIALFPTCLDRGERATLYAQLDAFKNLTIPHVHLRSDADEGELEYLSERFKTEAFNIHPRASEHPFPNIFPRFAGRIFVENTDIAPEREELEGVGGLCPDFSHWENAKLQGRREHDERMRSHVRSFSAGCCHLSAVRYGEPNAHNGEWDHHAFRQLADFDYLGSYRDFFPERWGSLELENSLEEQLSAAAHLSKTLKL